MSGHSKWNNIKNKKGAADAKRSKVFTQLSKQIRVAVKQGKSGDPKFNSSLRLVLDKARLQNMPKDKIDRAIAKGLGKSISGASVQEATYEGFGPGGVAFMVTAITDNPHRTSSELKFIFSRAGGSLAAPGSAGYLFEHRMVDGSEEYIPIMPMELDHDMMENIHQLIDTLRANDDVEDVFCSAAMAEDTDES